MREREGPRARRAARKPSRSWLTPKRVVIVGLTVVCLAGGGGFVVYTAMENAKRTPQPLGLAELGALAGGGDPFAPDATTDMLKAQAAQALRADELKESRGGTKRKLDSVYVPEKAPGGDGFPAAAFPPGSNPDPGSNKALGQRMNAARGWAGEWGCLEKLWEKESNWNERAMNRYSGAYGIPQSLPGSKMASVGTDWQVNPATQIEWGLTYIKGRYGSPCGAWGHSQAKGWY
ncbi:hypothetical protein SAMN05421505_10929 [Sinosporangium album]|uniref:Transglycosylase SLT domain-containing protein n=1 Tax=Sinosporangium album TaxID=504805 RepID=A0A1G7XY98_9ACTN|nr:hypothetical protein SAMN05421505_10929 [Sinosporangium album]